MANYQLLKADIDAKVYENAYREITGEKLNSVLNAMVTTLGAEYQFAGVATIDTNPGTPDAKVFYIANGKGTYTNFGSLEVTEDEVVVLYWDTAWHKVATGIASQAKLSELDKDINGEEVGIKEYVSLTSGRYFNTNPAVVGSPYSVGDPNAGATYSCVKVAVVAGEKYEVKGIAGGPATRVWVITGLGDIVLSRANHTIDYRTQPQILDITEDGFLYYNTKFQELC